MLDKIKNYPLHCNDRIKKEPVSFGSKRRIFANRNNNLTELLVSHIHLKNLHFNWISQRFWIPHKAANLFVLFLKKSHL